MVHKWPVAFMGLLIVSVVIGCGSMATRREFYEPITAELHKHNFDETVKKIETARRENKFAEKDRFLYFLDAGLAYHYALNYDSSNSRLTSAENTADELYTKSISRAALSMLLNDNALEYAGEDYEVLYTNLIMALNYLATDNFDEAFVEIRRSADKLELLEQKYAEQALRLTEASSQDTSIADFEYNATKVRFNNDAFARYLSMHMYAADGKPDDAAIDHGYLQAAFRDQPHIYNFDPPQVSYQSETGAVLSVVALAGMAPVKEVVNLRIRTDKDLDLVQVLITDSEGNESDYGHLPMPISADYYFKFAIPRVVPQPSEISEIIVFADSLRLGSLQLIEDIGHIARQTFEARKSLIYLRSVVRAVAKGLAAHKLKKKVDTGGLGGWLKKAAIDVGVDISENADLRCSHLLPGRIYVGDFELEPGMYDLTIEFLDLEGKVVSSSLVTNFDLRNGAFNLVEVFSFR